MKNLLKYIFLGLAVSFLASCGDSGSKKWRLDNKELTADEVANLKIAIAFRDEIIQKNEWAKLNGDFWSDILVFFPEEAKRCRELKGFEKFDGSNWANLLAEEPHFEKDCEKNRGWEAIPPKDWIKLLKKQPNYLSKAKHLNVFEKFTAENWYDVISSKNSLLLKECDASNGWKTLKANDWVALLKNKAIDENMAEKHNAFATLSLSDWIALISSDKKYIDLAKKHGVYSKLDNTAWAKLISKNSTFSAIAEKEGVFEKFTPNEWNMLFISNPEFTAVAKKSKALEKYSKTDLIKLYVLQPKLRNEIFALNKINLDFAKQIEILHRKATSEQTLNAEQFTVLSSVFPEFLDSISENSFSSYGVEDWKIALGKSPSFFKKISEKYAYLVPWKNLSFADWCEILDTNPDLAGTFKNNVKISELSVADITRAITNAHFKGYYTLDTLDLWSQFTPDQYFGLLANQGGMAAMIGLMENLGGVNINSVEDMQAAMYNFKQKEKRAANRALLNGDMSGYEELFPKPKREPRNYDDKFIISKAKQNGVFSKLTEGQWAVIFQHLSDKKDEKQNLLIKEYFSLEKQFPSITQKLVGSNNFLVISENKLWNKLSTKQWNDFIYKISKDFETRCYGDKDAESENLKQFKEIISHFDALNIIGKLNEKEILSCLISCVDVLTSPRLNNAHSAEIKDIKNKTFWNKFSKEIWMGYFSERDEFDIFCEEKANVKNWDKNDSLNFVEICFKHQKSRSPEYRRIRRDFRKFINTKLNTLTELEKTKMEKIFDALDKDEKFPDDFNMHSLQKELECKKCDQTLVKRKDYGPCNHIWIYSNTDAKNLSQKDGSNNSTTANRKTYEYRNTTSTSRKSSDTQPKTRKAKSIGDLVREANSILGE